MAFVAIPFIGALFFFTYKKSVPINLVLLGTDVFNTKKINYFISNRRFCNNTTSSTSASNVSLEASCSSDVNCYSSVSFNYHLHDCN